MHLSHRKATVSMLSFAVPVSMRGREPSLAG
jgi:hypothetical protein